MLKRRLEELLRKLQERWNTDAALKPGKDFPQVALGSRPSTSGGLSMSNTKKREDILFDSLAPSSNIWSHSRDGGRTPDNNVTEYGVVNSLAHSQSMARSLTPISDPPFSTPGMPFGDRQIPKEAGIPSGVMKGAIQIGKQHKTQGAWDGSSPKASSPGIRALKQSNRSSPTKYTENSVMEGEEDKLIAGWGARRRSDADDSSTHGGPTAIPTTFTTERGCGFFSKAFIHGICLIATVTRGMQAINTEPTPASMCCSE